MNSVLWKLKKAWKKFWTTKGQDPKELIVLKMRRGEVFIKGHGWVSPQEEWIVFGRYQLVYPKGRQKGKYVISKRRVKRHRKKRWSR